MTTGPILAETSFKDRVTMSFKLVGGLHMMRGNAKPYFSLTYVSHRKGFPGQCWSGGAGHHEILKRFPRFHDFAALHLSDIDGAPSHDFANAWYWYQGALGRGTAVNRRSGSTTGQAFNYFAEQVRIDAQAACEMVAADYEEVAFRGWIEAQRPRWKREADACIAKHGLVVYGDPYKPATA